MKDIVERLRERITLKAAYQPTHLHSPDWDKGDAWLNEAADEISVLRDDITERALAFEIHWECTRRATKLWQEQHPGQQGIWPDHANLCVWLMEQLEAIRTELSDFVDAYDDGDQFYAAAMLRDKLRHAQQTRTQQENPFCSCSEDGHNCSDDGATVFEITEMHLPSDAF